MVTLQVTTHGGVEKEISVDNYDPEELNAKLNDDEVHSIVIGSHIFSRIDIKNVLLVENVQDVENSIREED